MNNHSAGRQRSRRPAMALVRFALASGLVACLALGAPPDAPDDVLLESFRQLSDGINQAGWDDEYPLIERALHNIWRENDWTSEADRFARDLACEVAAIPPWEPIKRLDLLNERVEERYGLSGDDAARFHSMVMREAAGFLMGNLGLILEQTREGLEARIRAEPFTPEHIARWTKQGQPLMADFRERADRLAEGIKPMVDPTKRRTLERDLQSFEKRKRHVDKMSARWMKGEWQPADWGLQDDPIQTRRAPSATPPPQRDGRNKPPPRQQEHRKIPRWVPYDPSTWFAYVLDVERRFNLDAGQMSTAKSIHTELFERADAYAKSHAHAIKAVPPRERATHEAYEPICLLFQELESRLKAIPTTSQRDRNKQ